jgi:hypothetical protein
VLVRIVGTAAAGRILDSTWHGGRALDEGVE